MCECKFVCLSLGLNVNTYMYTCEWMYQRRLDCTTLVCPSVAPVITVIRLREQRFKIVMYVNRPRTSSFYVFLLLSHLPLLIDVKMSYLRQYILSAQ